jgi:HSP20 family protein
MMLVLEKFSPFGDLDLMERRMRRMFSEFLPFMPTVTPAADVYETEKEFVVELDVPGFAEKELDVEVTDHTLIIKGERKEEIEKVEKELRLHERLEATFERRFVLPVETDSEHLSAMYGKGVLTVHVPKTAAITPRKVEISKK